ncbi:MAG: DMT family transporter [Bacteroidota bacterium]
MSGRIGGILLLFFGMALFGSATPVSKLVGEKWPVFTASFFRVLLATLALLPFVAKDLRQHIRRLSKRQWRELSLIAAFGMAGFTLFLIYGMQFISGVAGSVVMAFTPALTALGAWLFLGERLGWRKVVAVLAGVGGIIFVNVFRGQFQPDESAHFFLGIGLVLLAISCEASYTLLGKKTTEDLPPLFVTFMACVLSLPLFLGLLFIDVHQLDFSALQWQGWSALLWWGVATLALGSALWYSGLERARGSTAAGFMSVMALSAITLSYFLLDEPFKWLHLPGIALVLISIGMMSWIHAQGE